MVKYDESTAKKGRKHVIDLRGSRTKAKIGTTGALSRRGKRKKKPGGKSPKGSVLKMRDSTLNALDGKPSKTTRASGVARSLRNKESADTIVNARRKKKGKRRTNKRVSSGDAARSTRAHMTSRKGKRYKRTRSDDSRRAKRSPRRSPQVSSRTSSD